MFLNKIKKTWQKRARRHQIQKAGEKDWKTFAKALCNSTKSCHGFPIDCPCCFESYVKATNKLGNIRKKSINV